MIAINTANITIHAPTPELNYAHCPSIARHAELFYVVWMGGLENREGGREQGILCSTSSDFLNWSEPEMIFAPPHRTCLFEPVIFTQGGQLFCTYSENHSDPDSDVSDAPLTEGHLMLSRLVSGSWETPRVIATTDGPDVHSRGCPTLSNPPLILPLPGGGMRILCAVHNLNHHTGRSCPRSLMSDDGGETWQAGAYVPTNQKKLMEASIHLLSDGCLAMLIRNDNDFPVIWRSVSSDNGETWSQAEPTGLRSWAKTSTLHHSSGRTLMLFNDDAPELSERSLAHDNETNAMLDPQTGNPLIWKLGPCVVRKNLSVAASEDGLSFTLAGRMDLESNGYGTSYPVGIMVDDTLYVVSSRRDSMHTRRPNMIRGHVIELLEQHARVVTGMKASTLSG